MVVTLSFFKIHSATYAAYVNANTDIWNTVAIKTIR